MRNVLFPNIPVHPLTSSFNREPWLSSKKTTPWRRNFSGKRAAAASETTAENALFNENLAALNANDASGAATLIKEAAGSSRLRESILFEQAHYAAKRMAPQAAELLANFITLAETPALKTQARLDQVEVALNLNPPDLETVQGLSFPCWKKSSCLRNRPCSWRD